MYVARKWLELRIDQTVRQCVPTISLNHSRNANGIPATQVAGVIQGNGLGTIRGTVEIREIATNSQLNIGIIGIEIPIRPTIHDRSLDWDRSRCCLCTASVRTSLLRFGTYMYVYILESGHIPVEAKDLQYSTKVYAQNPA